MSCLIRHTKCGVVARDGMLLFFFSLPRKYLTPLDKLKAVVRGMRSEGIMMWGLDVCLDILAHVFPGGQVSSTLGWFHCSKTPQVNYQE